MRDSRLVLEAMLDCLTEIARTLNSIEQHLRPEIKAKTIEIYFDTQTGPKKARDMGRKVILAGEKATGHLVIADAQGNPAKVDGAPKWSLTDESLGTLEVSEDGMSFAFQSNGKAGVTTLQAHADADLSEAVEELIAEGEIEVAGGKAAKVELVFD